MHLHLSSSGWEDLLDLLVDREVIASADFARTGYLGRGERHHGIGFEIDDNPATVLRLGAALAEAFSVIPELVELTADGYGAHDLLRDARIDAMGRGSIIYFPGHTAQAL